LTGLRSRLETIHPRRPETRRETDACARTELTRDLRGFRDKDACGGRVLAGLVQAAREPATRRAAPAKGNSNCNCKAAARVLPVSVQMPFPCSVAVESEYHLISYFNFSWAALACARHTTIGIFSSAALRRACGSAARKRLRGQQEKRGYCGSSSRDLFG
jgi:hypothetical protein